MAAIISQIAANKRARQKGGLGVAEVSSDKSVYTLPPFDPCFDPLVHNKYIRAVEQKRLLERLARKDEDENDDLAKPKNKSEASKEQTMSEVVTGLAILAFGLFLILCLVLYIWLVLRTTISYEATKKNSTAP